MNAGMEIAVRLDGEDGVYRSDEPLTGEVAVRADEDVEFNELRVVPVWRAHGRAATETGVLTGEYFDGESVGGGETRTYAFEFELPAGPYTYHGHYINVDWEIRAEADVDWAFDPSDNVEFRLNPGAVDEYNPGAKTLHEQVADHGSDDQTVSKLGLVVSLGAVVVGAILFGASSGVVGGGSFHVLPSLFGLVFVGVGAAAAYESVKNYFAEMKLGDVDVGLAKSAAAPGEMVEWAVTFVPSSDVELNGLSVTLEGYEEVEVQQGTDTRTYTETLHSETQQPGEVSNGELPAGERAEYRGEFELPETRAFSFACDDHEIDWDVHFHLDVASWPDWEHEEGLILQPDTEPNADVEASNPPSAEDAAPGDGEGVQEVATEW